MEKEVHKKNIEFVECFIMKKNFSWIDYRKPINISYFSKGGGTYIYLIQNNNKKYLARINFYSLKNKWKTKRQEYKILRLIENLKISPKIYLLNEKNSLEQDFVIVDYVEGKEIKEFKKQDIAGLANILRRLHQFNIKYNKKKELPYKCEIYDEFANGEDKKIEKYNNLKNLKKVIPIYNKLKNDLGVWFNGLDIFNGCENLCLCHADLKRENILRHKSEIKLIDWECAGIDIPESDIGRLFSGCRFTKAQQEFFLDKYFNRAVKDIEKLRINAIKIVLNFFLIIEDYCIHKRKNWSAISMIKELDNWRDSFEKIKKIR